MSEMLPLTAWTIAGALLTGLMLALLGSLKMAVARRPERAAGPLTVMLFLLNVLLVPLLVASGLVIDRWGLRPVMIAGPVLLALALLALSTGAGYRRTQAAVAVAGLGASGIATASVVLMPRALFGEQQLVASLQLGMVFVALGALVAVPLIDVLLRVLDFRRTMALLALVCLLPAFLAPLATRKQLELHSTEPTQAFLEPLLHDPLLWLGCLVFFIYAPLEGFVGVWASTHLAALGEPAKRARRALYGFWAGVLLARLVLATVQHTADLRDTLSPWLLVPPAILAAAALGNLAAVPRAQGIGWRLFLLGLFLGPIYPFLVGLLFATPGGRAMPGTGYALLCASGSLGGLVLSPLVGYCARSRNLQVALLIPTFLALILSAVALIFSLNATGQA
jgi:fucose permease